MKLSTYKILSYLVICSMIVTIAVVPASAIRIPIEPPIRPPPSPPPVQNPSVGVPTCESDSLYQVTIKVSVTWHYYPFQSRYVQIYVSGKGWYTMSPIGGRYQRSISGLSPYETYNYKIKARETFYQGEPPELITASTTTSYRTIDNCMPKVTVEFINTQEQQVTCKWSITSWGREGQGVNPNAYLKFRHPESDNNWDVEETKGFSNGVGYYDLTGLAAATSYEYYIQVKHTVDGFTVYSSVKSGTFQTEGWIPNRKIAVILMVDGNQDDDREAHLRDYNAMYSFALGRFDEILPKVYTAESSVSEFKQDLVWPKSLSDANSLVFYYIVGHGAGDKVYIGSKNNGQTCYKDEIDAQLDTIVCGKMVLIFETCGGALLSESSNTREGIGGANRIILGAAEGEAAINRVDDLEVTRCVFTYYLLQKLPTSSLYDAFCYSASQSAVHSQTPRLDDLAPHIGTNVDDIFLGIGYDGQRADAINL